MGIESYGREHGRNTKFQIPFWCHHTNLVLPPKSPRHFYSTILFLSQNNFMKYSKLKGWLMSPICHVDESKHNSLQSISSFFFKKTSMHYIIFNRHRIKRYLKRNRLFSIKLWAGIKLIIQLFSWFLQISIVNESRDFLNIFLQE